MSGGTCPGDTCPGEGRKCGGECPTFLVAVILAVDCAVVVSFVKPRLAAVEFPNFPTRFDSVVNWVSVTEIKLTSSYTALRFRGMSGV